MKKVLSFILIGLFSFSVFAANDLYVRGTSGDTKISIGSIKEIKFPSGSVVITMTDGSSKTYPSSSFVSLRFDGNTSSGVENIMNESELFFDGTIVKTAQAGISIYSTDGRLVLATDATQANISSLASGIYIVKTGCTTTKIVK